MTVTSETDSGVGSGRTRRGIVEGDSVPSVFVPRLSEQAARDPEAAW